MMVIQVKLKLPPRHRTWSWLHRARRIFIDDNLADCGGVVVGIEKYDAYLKGWTLVTCDPCVVLSFGLRAWQRKVDRLKRIQGAVSSTLCGIYRELYRPIFAGQYVPPRIQRARGAYAKLSGKLNGARYHRNQWLVALKEAEQLPQNSAKKT